MQKPNRGKIYTLRNKKSPQDIGSKIAKRIHRKACFMNLFGLIVLETIVSEEAEVIHSVYDTLTEAGYKVKADSYYNRLTGKYSHTVIEVKW